jgi:hypothetical protein
VVNKPLISITMPVPIDVRVGRAAYSRAAVIDADGSVFLPESAACCRQGYFTIGSCHPSQAEAAVGSWWEDREMAFPSTSDFVVGRVGRTASRRTILCQCHIDKQHQSVRRVVVGV